YDEVTALEVGGERGGVTAAQPVVQLERRPDERGLEPLGQVRLEDVTREDVLDHAGHGVEVAGAREVGSHAWQVRDRVGGGGGTPGASLRDTTTRSLRETPGV